MTRVPVCVHVCTHVCLSVCMHCVPVCVCVHMCGGNNLVGLGQFLCQLSPLMLVKTLTEGTFLNPRKMVGTVTLSVTTNSILKESTSLYPLRRF
jgi:hypothetical protein